MYKILLAASLLLLLGESKSFAQQIVNHTGQSFASEDGNPRYDEDGTVNGIVVWKSSAVHVVNYYSISGTAQFPNPVFIIRPGAVVKFANSFDTTGGTLHWTPTQSGYFSAGTDAATLQIDGASITDIRDDTIGGDTNGDGSASTPSNGGWGFIRFSGSARDVLSNSILKYVYKIGHIGSMQIVSNTFV